MSKVSFIIPCYDIENYISFSLDSVINQDYKNIEVICVNDGSNDGTEDIIKRYMNIDDRIKLVNKENGGQASARNLGLEYSTGDYIHFLDGDDYVSPLLAKSTVALAEKYNTDIVFFNYFMLNAVTKTFSVLPQNNREKNRENILILNKDLSDNDILRAGTTTCYRLYKADFLKNNNIKFIEGMVYEDSPYSIEALCKAERMVFSPLPLYCYRVCRDGSTMTASAGMKYSDCFRALEARDEILKTYGVYKRYKEIYMHLDLSFLFLAHNRIEQKYKKEFYEAIREYLKTFNFDEFPKYTTNFQEQYEYVKLMLEYDYDSITGGNR